MGSSFYDIKWESEWDAMVRLGPFHRHIRRVIFGLLEEIEFRSVMDVGCGRGAFLEEMEIQYPHIESHGIDISSAAIEIAKKTYPQRPFWVLDISKEKIDKRFDLIICSEVLEHIEDDILALENIAQMAKKYVVISTPQGRMRRFEKKVGHVRNYSRAELEDKLVRCGLRPIKIVEWGFPFYSPLYRDFLDMTGARGTTGNFGLTKQILASFLYYLFFLNSSVRGDELFILAEREQLPNLT